MNKKSLQKLLGLPKWPAPGFYYEWTRALPGQDSQVLLIRASFGAATSGVYLFRLGNDIAGRITEGPNDELVMEMEDRSWLDTFLEELRGMTLDMQYKEY